MKTVLINASPKTTDSSSRCLLDCFRGKLREDAEQIELHGEHVPQEDLDRLAGAATWVFFFPLYVDALPSHLLSCLVDLAAMKESLRPVTVYAVVNCGFFEGCQTRHAFEVMSNWASAMGFMYRGGAGIGCGGALQAMRFAEKGPMTPVVRELGRLAKRVENPSDVEHAAYVTMAMPRFLYKAAGEAGWRRDLRRNGGHRKELGRKIAPPSE